MNGPVIRVVEEIGPYCITDTDGENLWSTIIRRSYVHDRVYVDFHRVEVMTATFANAAFGDRMSYMEIEEFHSKHALCGLSELQRRIVDLSLRNMREYHTVPAVKAAVDAMAVAT